MQVQVAVVNGAPGDAEDLLRWLRTDPTGSRTEPRLTGGDAEQMGAGELILAGIATTVALGDFLLVAATWLDARRGRVTQGRRLRIERLGDRMSVTLDGASEEEVERALRELLRTDERTEDEGE
ncbi:effector-associated constant component EACC1 [Streptomyces paradoxus]|uniref:effector-associated constant component EACC1 n=1 Tax=Streptomyces paradoxus TaxID=66375 RepID=UPI0037D72D83